MRKLLALVLALACCASISCAGGNTGAKTKPTTTIVSGPTAISTITSLGGVVGLPDGTRVTLPADALTAPLPISLSETGTVPAPLSYVTPVGRPVHLDLHGQQLAQPATFEIPIDITKIPKDVRENQVFAAYFDDSTHAWVPVGGTVDLQRHMLVVQLTHASWWAPWTWNWDAWTAVLSKLLDLKLTSLFDAVTTLTTTCAGSTQHVSVDNSGAQGLIKGCVDRDDASAPSVHVTNLKSFAISLAGGDALPQRVLFAGDSADFSLDTSGASPLDVKAVFSVESFVWFVADIAVTALPMADALPEKAIAGFAHDIAASAPILAAAEELAAGNAKGAEEDLVDFVKSGAFITTFTNDVVAYGKQHALGTLANLTEGQVRRVILVATAGNIVLKLADFLTSLYFDHHSQVAFAWKQPPCPVDDGSFCAFASAAGRAFMGSIDADWFNANVREGPCPQGGESCSTNPCVFAGTLDTDGGCVSKQAALEDTRKLTGQNLRLFGVIYPVSGILKGSSIPDGPALLFASYNSRRGIMAIATRDASGWKISTFVDMDSTGLYRDVPPQKITFLATSGIDPTWVFRVTDRTPVAYIASDGNVHVVAPDGSDDVQITTDGYDSYPAWSSDHKRIAFVHMNGPAGSATNTELDVMNADGTARKVIVPSFEPWRTGLPGPAISPLVTNVRWSHDACTIYAHVAPGPVGMHPIQSIPVCGGAGSSDNFAHFFDVNQRGAVAISTYDGDGTYSLTVGSIDGTTKVANIAEQDEGPVAWSPDGTQLALRHRDSISILSAAGQLLRTLPAGPSDQRSFYGAIAWSPSGGTLVYDTDAGVVIADAASGIQHRLAAGSEPSW